MELRTGQTGLVGRASWAEMPLTKDLSMAGQHFSIQCAGGRCTLQAQARQHPVYVNGTKVGQEDLKDGDEIVAGANTFRVRVELEAGEVVPPAAPAPVPPPRPTPEPAARKPQERPPDLLDTLRWSQPLFALLDAARDPRVLELLRDSREPYQCLYEGYTFEEMELVAPYLVRLPPTSKLLEALVREGHGKSWGVYLTAHSSLDEVRKHFRHFLMVKGDGEEYVFRFYDPRVLRAFLPACDAGETAQFFGPVERFLVEAKDPALLLRFTATREGVKEEPLLLFAL
jgi:hypothetical protein